MKPLFIINDVHIAARRSAGTTPTTAWALRQNILERYEDLLNLAGDDDVMVLGDLFDEFNTPMHDLLAAYRVTSNWLEANPVSVLDLVAGNHDLATDSTKLSAFEFFAQLLVSQYPERVKLIKGSEMLRDGFYVISHTPNQDLMNLELDAVPEGTRYLFLHCNFDNFFAAESDHSLNLSEEAARKLVDRGITIVSGHEHQHKKALGGKVIMIGNQIPSSVADCLGNDEKFALRITDDGETLVPVWYAKDEFARVQWDDLPSYMGDANFIRVEGKADAAQAADVISLISKFRSKSPAFVITNAVKIGETDIGEDLQITAEDVRSFDVLASLLEVLTPEEGAVVKDLLSRGGVA